MQFEGCPLVGLEVDLVKHPLYLNTVLIPRCRVSNPCYFGHWGVEDLQVLLLRRLKIRVNQVDSINEEPQRISR